MRTPVLSLLIILPFCAYSQQADKSGFIPYQDEAIGWTTRYSIWFKRMTDEEIKETESKGKELMEEALEIDSIDMSHRNLLWLKENAGNTMTSSVQAFDAATDGSYEDLRKTIHAAIEESYSAKGIKYSVVYGIREVDGLEFSTMEILLYAPGTQRVMMAQIMYDRLINGRLALMLNINYTNELSKKILLETINSSKFSLRD
jgi:hypothetical protein